VRCSRPMQAGIILPAGMPVGVACLTVRGGFAGCADHAILQLGIDACAATEAVHKAPLSERATLLDRALDLRTRELDAWTGYRTRDMPEGDKIGQSMAAMGIANVHFMRQQLDPFNMETLEHARCWYSRAEALCPALGAADDSPAALAQRNLVCGNSLALDLYAASRFLHQQVRLCGLVTAKHYNGRCGTVYGVHEPARYAVRLHGTRDMAPAVLLVHERNFARI
jgi:hypothetical protein